MQKKSGSEDMTEQVRSRAEKIRDIFENPDVDMDDELYLVVRELADFRREVLREAMAYVRYYRNEICNDLEPGQHAKAACDGINNGLERLSEGGE